MNVSAQVHEAAVSMRLRCTQPQRLLSDKITSVGEPIHAAGDCIAVTYSDAVQSPVAQEHVEHACIARAQPREVHWIGVDHRRVAAERVEELWHREGNEHRHS